MRVKEESGKAGLKLNIHNTNILHPVPSLYGKDEGGKVEAVTYFLFLERSQNHCSHEIRSCLLLERKAMTNLDSVLKSRGITLTAKSV